MSLIIAAHESEAVRTYPAGRVCRMGGCRTILSRYNPGEWCSRHEPEPSWRYCGYTFAVCTECGAVKEGRHKGPLCADCNAKAKARVKFKRTCRHCGLTHPETDEFFAYIRPWHLPEGTCRECDKAMKREAERKRRDSAVVVFPNKTYRMELK